MTHTNKFIKQAILFDLDGVLVDSTSQVENLWRLWARQRGLDPDKVVRAAHGRRTIETVREFAPQLGSHAAKAEAARLDHAEAGNLEGLHVVAGAAELIAQIPDRRWAVCTSGICEVATFRLRAMGIPVPRVLVSAEMVTEGKPDPQPYLRTAEQLGYSASDCLVLEDSPAGILSGKRAGAAVVAVATTYPASDLQNADATVPDLRAIAIKVVEDGRLRIEIVGG